MVCVGLKEASIKILQNTFLIGLCLNVTRALWEEVKGEEDLDRAENTSDREDEEEEFVGITGREEQGRTVRVKILDGTIVHLWKSYR